MKIEIIIIQQNKKLLNLLIFILKVIIIKVLKVDNYKNKHRKNSVDILGVM